MKNVAVKRKIFKLPRMVQTAIYLPLVFLIFYICLRQLEFMLTYHPQPYQGGPEWTLPANGEDVWCEVDNSQKVHGWYIHAQTAPAFATVLFCHGNGGNITNVAWIAQELSKRNLNVLIFDYRGYGRSEGKISDEWGLYADTDAAYDYLIRERGLEDQRLVLMGESLGSTAAIDLASRRPCGALVVESGLSSASDMGIKAFPWLPRWLHLLARNRFDSVGKIAKVNRPVLITHGTSDEVIPVDQGRKLYESAREPKKLIIVQGGKHNLFDEGGEAYINQIVDFIRESLK
jgi:uncharacterized protein